MADKKALKKRKKGSSENDSANKDETEVAKQLRFNLKTKKATMYGDEVFYFMGSNAVDFLLDSKWASGHKSSISFTHRDSVVSFLSRLLNYGLFSRVHLIKIEKKIKKKDDDKKKENKKLEEKDKEKKPPSSPKAKKDKEVKETKKVKKKVKTTLEPHEQQIFFDSDDEAYVWIYDPISWKTFILGILLVIAVIVICLFPLWPESVREYSWYVSVAGAVFVGAILVLAVLRYIIYAVLWLGTMGKLHFWLLPNLTAECGFFESFVPFYEYETKNNKKEKDKKVKKRVSNKNGNAEDDEKSREMDCTQQDKDVSQEKTSNEDSSNSMNNDDWVKIDEAEGVPSDQKTEINC